MNTAEIRLKVHGLEANHATMDPTQWQQERQRIMSHINFDLDPETLLTYFDDRGVGSFVRRIYQSTPVASQDVAIEQLIPVAKDQYQAEVSQLESRYPGILIIPR